MALFGSHWNEDDRIPQERGSRAMLNDLRPKMEWIQKSAPAARFYCSNCGNDEMYKTPFCPECGAMRRDLE